MHEAVHGPGKKVLHGVWFRADHWDWIRLGIGLGIGLNIGLRMVIGMLLERDAENWG